jgi:predicted transcriptional regulator YdeE
MQIETFNIIGIAIRTTNENGQSSQDIPALWNQFMSTGILAQIPNKIDDSIYCIYTDYEKDHTQPYTTILGCKVAHLDDIPAPLVGKVMNAATYAKHTVKGNLMEGIVFNEWVKIWNTPMPRTFIADFEIYGQKAQDPNNAEVDIFVGIQ